MKTTVEIDDQLFRTARKRAIDERRSFRAVLNDALRAYVGSSDLGQVPSSPVAGEEAPPERYSSGFRRDVLAAEYWLMVSDRSRWDELLGARARLEECTPTQEQKGPDGPGLP
jgi:hypothetical protein